MPPHVLVRKVNLLPKYLLTPILYIQNMSVCGQICQPKMTNLVWSSKSRSTDLSHVKYRSVLVYV